MARHILAIARSWWDQYSLPILLLFTGILFLGHRVEKTNETDILIVSGFYGPGAVTAWMITAFSTFYSGSRPILLSKLRRSINLSDGDDRSEHKLEPLTRNDWDQLPSSERLKVYETLWPPERLKLRLWDPEAVAVASYAIIAYIHMSSKWWGKDDVGGLAFSCSSQGVAAHNVILLITFISHVILITGHMQDQHPAGYDPRRGISTFFGTWSTLIHHGALLAAMSSLRYPFWMQACHCLAFALPLLLEATRKGGVKIVCGSRMIPFHVGACALAAPVVRLANGKLLPCDGIKVVIGFPFPKSGATWTDLDQVAAIAAAAGALLYKGAMSEGGKKAREAWLRWRHNGSERLNSIQPRTDESLDGHIATTKQSQPKSMNAKRSVGTQTLNRRHSFDV
jgi:hypothetical protein